MNLPLQSMYSVLFFDLELGKSVEKTALTSNLSQQDITKTIATKNSFVREVLTIWAEINFEKQVTSKTQFLSQSIWHNSLIRIANYPVFYPDWFNKGVKKVKDFKDDSAACPLKYYGRPFCTQVPLEHLSKQL